MTNAVTAPITAICAHLMGAPARRRDGSTAGAGSGSAVASVNVVMKLVVNLGRAGGCWVRASRMDPIGQ